MMLEQFGVIQPALETFTVNRLINGLVLVGKSIGNLGFTAAKDREWRWVPTGVAPSSAKIIN
jgi:hypothetical protein